MGDLIQLPTYNGSNESYGFIPPGQILKCASEKELQDVLVIGWDKNEDLYIASSGSELADLIYLLERARVLLMSQE